MQKFRKKPVVIEAVQLKLVKVPNGSLTTPGASIQGNIQEVCQWMGVESRVGFTRVTVTEPMVEGGTDLQIVGYEYKPVLQIHTLEGVMEATDGDWIIKGVQGEFYPCKPAIFEATYDPA